MKNTITTGVITVLGTAGGFYIGWTLAKKKYERLADQEVESVKQSLKEYYEKTPEPEKVETDSSEDSTPSKSSGEKQDILDDGKSAYMDYSAAYRAPDTPERIPGAPGSRKKVEKEETSENKQGPYLISPDDFLESTYETVTLFYYTDKVLADDDYNVIHDIVGHIGEDTLTQFGVYEEDAVYVRNDILGIDYEILLDERAYYKIAPKYVNADTADNE